MSRIARPLNILIPMLGLTLGGCAMAQSEAAQSPPTQAIKQKAIIDFRSCAKPQYPHAEMTAKHQGTVTLLFQVDGEGKVAQAKVAKSSGFPALDDSARDALASCRFKPAIAADGKPALAWVPVQYVWSLE